MTIAIMTRFSARWQARTDGFVPVDRDCSCYKQSLAGDDPTLALHIRRCETVLLRGDSTMREESHGVVTKDTAMTGGQCLTRGFAKRLRKQ
jgi:hypothetical protein